MAFSSQLVSGCILGWICGVRFEFKQFALVAFDPKNTAQTSRDRGEEGEKTEERRMVSDSEVDLWEN